MKKRIAELGAEKKNVAVIFAVDVAVVVVAGIGWSDEWMSAWIDKRRRGRKTKETQWSRTAPFLVSFLSYIFILS